MVSRGFSNQGDPMDLVNREFPAKKEQIKTTNNIIHSTLPNENAQKSQIHFADQAKILYLRQII